MKRVFLSICAFLAIFNFIFAQRMLEPVAEPLNSVRFSTTVTDGHLIFAQNFETYLLTFNGFSYSRNYFPPSESGGRLIYLSDWPLVTFRNSTYLVLGLRFLYAHTASAFARIPVPGTLESAPVVLGDNLYILSNTGSIVKLYRYNGISVAEVPFAFMPPGGRYELRVHNNNIYIIGIGISGAFPYILKRFDGISTFTFPVFDFPIGIKKILPVGETGRVYFLMESSRILYFDGSRILPVVDDVAGAITDAVIWRDDLYFLSIPRDRTSVPLRRIIGTTVTEIPLPPDAFLFRPTSLTVYNDALYFETISVPDLARILRYDGSTFSTFYTIPGTTITRGSVFTRDRSLIIQPENEFGNTAYEYDGSTFTSIQCPPPYKLGTRHGSYLGALYCNHFWISNYQIPTSSLTYYSIMKEARLCEDPPPTPVLVLPRFFLQFESFSNSYRARDDRECWSDIIVDWEIDPICPVPEICPRTLFQLALSDAGGKVAWQHEFDKPIEVVVPLDGKQPFKTSLSATENELKDLIVLDQDLVEKGVTEIGLRMKPKEGNYELTVLSKSGMIVPVKVSLLNKEGESIWEKEFKAPFTEIIKDRVAEPGEKLHFSVVALQEEINTKIENSTSFTYLNPSHGALSINVKDKQENAEAELMITTILGQKLVDKRIKTPANLRIELPEYKAGLYVIIIQTRDGRKTNKIVWLK